MKVYITLFILLSHFNTYCQKKTNDNIYVALSLNDCINCNISLNVIEEKLKNPKINFIFSEELKNDSTLVYQRTSVDKYINGNIIYSDSLYSVYSRGVKSTISITKDKKIIYSDFLYHLDVNKFLSQYNQVNNNNCYPGLKKGVQKIQDDETLLINNTQLKRWTYYTNSTATDILADSLWMKKAYEIYYNKKDWKKEYKKAYKLLLQYPNMLPEIHNGVKTDEKLLFLVNIKILEKDANNDDINVVQKFFLVNYNYSLQTISDMHYIDTKSLEEKGYYLNPSCFVSQKNQYLFSINSLNDPVANTKHLAVFKQNPKAGNSLKLQEILPEAIPNNYIKYNLKNNFHDYAIDGDLVFLKFGEYIYDWKNNIEYPFPLSEDEFNSLKNIYDFSLGKSSSPTYYIYDILNTKDEIKILYTNKTDNLMVMVINKKTKSISANNVLFNTSELSKYQNSSSFAFKNQNQLVYLDNNNCIAYKGF